jgi:aconitate hydratase
VELVADEGADYDAHEIIDLSKLEPLIAKPSSPGNVVPVADIAGQPLYQAYIGSSANPGYRDYAMAAAMVEGKTVSGDVSFDINPSSRGILATLMRDGYLMHLVQAGARLHQSGCNGCIGMGQAPASGRNSLRTTPRNFPGRSGTREDSVFLCSPETATASALMGVITDPRTLGMAFPDVHESDDPVLDTRNLAAPLTLDEARKVELVKGPNIASLPETGPMPDSLELPVLLKVGDDISTDEIMPAGVRVLPFRSNIPKIAEFVYGEVDEGYSKRAREQGDHAIVGGANYGQGSSREHAALAPRYLGLRAVLAKGFARIHWQNLVNFGVLPLTFARAEDYDGLEQGDVIAMRDLREGLAAGSALTASIKGKGEIELAHELSPRQIEVLLAGGLINWMREREAA